MSISKEEFRKYCLNKLRKNYPNRFYIDKIIEQRVLQAITSQKGAKRILLYIPLPMEANIGKIFKKLRKKYEIFVPFMEGKSFKMVPYRLPLKKKRFGIYEAGQSYKILKNIDIAIVPIVGIDKNFKRIGFGKGMYDRFFAKLRKKPYTIFVQIKKCATNQAIGDSYDISCDLLITSDCVLESEG